MKISTEELGELLVAIGTVLKSGGTGSEEAAVTQPTMETFEIATPGEVETGTFELSPEPAEPAASQLSETERRIKELEAELSKVKESSNAVLGLQPIKLNNSPINAEVNNG